MLYIILTITISFMLSLIIYQLFNNKVRTKKLIEFTNKSGEKYWEVMINNKKTGIKWTMYSEALFFYEHVTSIPKFKYIYSSLKSDPYYITTIENERIYIIPKYEDYDYYAYRDIPKDRIVNLNYSKKICRSLQQVYNNIIGKNSDGTDIWEEKIILSTDNDKNIEKQVELSITNNDIKALQKIIKEYSDSVALSKIVADKLCNLK